MWKAMKSMLQGDELVQCHLGRWGGGVDHGTLHHLFVACERVFK